MVNKDIIDDFDILVENSDEYPNFKINAMKNRLNTPAISLSGKSNTYYVYRHYYYNNDDKQVTFYVGKGKGLRATSKTNRSSIWEHRVNLLNGNYFIDIIEFFDNEKDAFDFEKEVISYYTMSEFGCECNQISKKEKIDDYLDDINGNTIETLLDLKTPLETIIKSFSGMYRETIGKNVMETMLSFTKFLKKTKSKYEICFNAKDDLKDIRSYSYKLMKKI
jgi:hypothetical protein